MWRIGATRSPASTAMDTFSAVEGAAGCWRPDTAGVMPPTASIRKVNAGRQPQIVIFGSS
jgi:hypothetical protein